MSLILRVRSNLIALGVEVVEFAEAIAEAAVVAFVERVKKARRDLRVLRMQTGYNLREQRRGGCALDEGRQRAELVRGDDEAQGVSDRVALEQ